MENQHHSISNLFAQLGLPSSEADIEAFIEAHRPLNLELALWDAPFWTPAQSQFLHEQIKNDADWVVAIDRFDTRLRKEELSH